MNSTTDRFEDRLLGELRDVVSARQSDASPVPAPRAVRRFPAKTRLAVAAAAVVAVGVSAPALLSNGGSPAYAIEEQDDGSIEITIHMLENPDALEAELEARGVSAEVDYTSVGKYCADVYRGVVVNNSNAIALNEDGADPDISFIVFPGELEDNQGVFLTISDLEPREAGSPPNAVPTLNLMGVVAGPIAPCVLVDSDYTDGFTDMADHFPAPGD